jgi:hypothetical protein
MEDEYKERDNHSESRNFFSVVSGDRLRSEISKEAPTFHKKIHVLVLNLKNIKKLNAKFIKNG